MKASAHEYPKHRDCFSCHNQAVPAVALSLARQRGFDVDAQTLRTIAEHTEADLNGAIDDYRKGKGQPGGVIRAGYALVGSRNHRLAADETTAAVVHYLTMARGSTTIGRRNPNELPPSQATSRRQRWRYAVYKLLPFRPRDQRAKTAIHANRPANPK